MELVVIGFISAFIIVPIFLLAYLWARTKNFYSMVDVVWSYSFALLAILYYMQAGNGGLRVLIFCLMFALWSLRLGTHLILRLQENFPKEDKRYADLRERWKDHLDKNFFLFFAVQGLSVILLSMPLMIVVLNPTREFGIFETIGLLVWLIGIGGESLADWQLKKFLADPANKGEVCQKGLWYYSRHPNYFFEWFIWLGYFFYALPCENGWIAVLGPAIMLFLLTKVTGVPYAEASSLKTKGDKFRAYQKSTSVFVPLPKKV